MSTRVLVVDDEKNMRTTLADILAEEGFDVDTADCGEKAVKMCGRRRFDVVLMDMRMPGIDGVEACRRIKCERDDVRVIMMSAYSMQELQKTAMQQGASGFVRKPLDVEDVVNLLRPKEPSGSEEPR